MNRNPIESDVALVVLDVFHSSRQSVKSHPLFPLAQSSVRVLVKRGQFRGMGFFYSLKYRAPPTQQTSESNY